MSEGIIIVEENNNFTVKSEPTLIAKDKITIIFQGGKEESLDVEIKADFSKLKPEHHDAFFRSFANRYNHHVNVYNTHMNYDGTVIPPIKCEAVEKKSFWEQIKDVFRDGY